MLMNGFERFSGANVEVEKWGTDVNGDDSMDVDADEDKKHIEGTKIGQEVDGDTVVVVGAVQTNGRKLEEGDTITVKDD